MRNAHEVLHRAAPMRCVLPILLLGLVGCARLPAPRSTEAPAQLLLAQLKKDLDHARVAIGGNPVEMEVEWVTHEYAANCMRPLDLNLPDHRLGAFLHVGDRQAFFHGEQLPDLAAAFAPQVESYLKAAQIPERKVYAGRDIGDYMTGAHRNPPGVSQP